jgi:hypothetical protein
VSNFDARTKPGIGFVGIYVPKFHVNRIFMGYIRA